MDPNRRGIDWKKWRVMAGLYLVTNLAFVIQRVTFDLQRGTPLEIVSSLLDLAGFAGVWILLAVAIVRMTADRPLTPANIALFFAAGIGFSLLHGALYLLFAISVPGLMTTGQPGSAGEFFIAVAGLAHAWRFLSFGFLVVVSYAYDYYVLAIERERRAVQLQARLTEAKLDALRMQMHPHFLFNTLNAISVLVDENPGAAKVMISRLGELLRLSLENVGTQEVPLRRELEFLDHYLLILQTRYGDRLGVKREISAGTVDAAVPYLLLQPVVENALKHGIDTLPGPGTITISSRREDGYLVLRVEDAGPGSRSAGVAGAGIGLSNTEARLRQLYGGAHSVAMEAAADGRGTSVTIRIPFRNAGPGGQTGAGR